MPNFTQEQLQEIAQLLQQNRKIEAVKWVIDHSNLGLKDAKDYIDQFFKNQTNAHLNIKVSTIETTQHLTNLPLPELLKLIQNNQKIEAVKLVRDHLNLSLAEAKNFVEQLAEDPNFEDPNLEHSNLQILDSFHAIHDSIYKAIQTHFDTGEIYILYKDGRKERIDEDHPEWDDIMEQFGQGEYYDSAEDYLDAMEIKNQEIQQDSSPSRPSVSRPSSIHSQPVGIEDQSKKKGVPLFVIMVLVIIIAVIAYQFTQGH